ncbi:MAG: recombinase RecT [Tannerella sp.]|jgi:recombination protein RecT|nr:recombinase RecT [Tannerella sp.]
MENKVETRKKIDLLKSILNAESVEGQFRNALNKNSGPFIASVIDLYNGDKGLQECEPKQVVMEALKAAVLKLPINKALGFAYVIKFNNKELQDDGTYKKVATPTFIPGYKGYIQLAMRTGQYRTINADIVYEGELNRINKLTGEITFDGEKKSDKVMGYFAYFELINGFSKTLYVSLCDMAKHAKTYSPSIKFDKKVTAESLEKLAGKAPTGIGWTGGFDDMAIKTVLRNLLSKYGYLSIEMQGAIADDMGIDSRAAETRELPVQTIDVEPDDEPENPVTPGADPATAGEKKNVPPYMQQN